VLSSNGAVVFQNGAGLLASGGGAGAVPDGTRLEFNTLTLNGQTINGWQLRGTTSAVATNTSFRGVDATGGVTIDATDPSNVNANGDTVSTTGLSSLNPNVLFAASTRKSLLRGIF
jgi:hypothetical protein